MKMVKSLLLGSVTGIVAVAGAQAADLPVKAKPVEYVKVCSLYGAGFYYIPGTDICMKVGGYVRSEMSYGYGASMTTGPFLTSGTSSLIDSASDFVMRSRAYITTDTRQQTAYGTLRTYLNVGVNYDSPAANATGFSANRAMIQIAGFTAGLATSFYDYYSAAATSYLQFPSSDTGDGGYKVLAYTAQFGNGVSATLSVEEPRRNGIINASLSGAGTGAFNANNTTVGFSFNDPFLVASNNVADTAKIRYPDIVANLRVDQAWGGAQIMGAIHDASGGYYGATVGNWNNGHPGDKMGWAAGVGLRINTPFISPGDYFQMQANYSVGASRYVGFTQFGSGNNPFMFKGNTIGLGYWTDGVYCGYPTSATVTLPQVCNGAPSTVELTTVWGVNAAYEHFWTPALRTSVYGAYLATSYNTNARTLISASTCGGFALSGGSVGTPAAPQGSLTGMSNCSPNWSFWGIGSRSQWNVTKDFYIGLDTYYAKLRTAFAGTANYRAVAGTGAPSGTYTIQDQDVWASRFRIHRDIVP